MSNQCSEYNRTKDRWDIADDILSIVYKLVVIWLAMTVLTTLNAADSENAAIKPTIDTSITEEETL